MPQDVKRSADGRIFCVADMQAGGLWELNGDRMKTVGFIRTGRGTHGLYPSRDGRLLYVTNRTAGTISVLSYREGRRHGVCVWPQPGRYSLGHTGVLR